MANRNWQHVTLYNNGPASRECVKTLAMLKIFAWSLVLVDNTYIQHVSVNVSINHCPAHLQHFAVFLDVTKDTRAILITDFYMRTTFLPV